jgi:hypothetical protein
VKVADRSRYKQSARSGAVRKVMGVPIRVANISFVQHPLHGKSFAAPRCPVRVAAGPGCLCSLLVARVTSKRISLGLPCVASSSDRKREIHQANQHTFHQIEGSTYPLDRTKQQDANAPMDKSAGESCWRCSSSTYLLRRELCIIVRRSANTYFNITGMVAATHLTSV